MPENRAQDEAAITAVLENVYKAWEANDADAFVADYTEDATAIMPGSYREGREAIRRSMAAGYAGPLKGTSTHNKQISVRFLGQDGAVVVSESGILFPGETELPSERAVHASWVLERRDGRWLVAAYHNCPINPAPKAG
ncbi:SgcJ/EcaC family oxidoreductase [Streptomyces sp. NPDC019224]|uniref:SgcJ/EcaC family oxidoreductase n=1 Tax=Streptomyces sp. NPDC019224 TaxID=3154484 RepID=UPI0033C4A9C3